MGKALGDDTDETKLDEPFREFVKETTLHGIRNATSSNSCLFRRFLWFIAFVAASGYLTYQVVMLALDYYSYPFKTVSRIVPKTSNEFPAVTICNINKFNSNMVNFSMELKTIYRLAGFRFVPGLFDQLLEKYRDIEPYASILKHKHLDLIQMAAPTIDMTFLWCAFDGDLRPCNQFITYTNTPSGRCFVFNGERVNLRQSSRHGNKGGFFTLMAVDQSELMDSAFQSAGFTVVVHSQNDAPDEQNSILISPGFYNEIRFTEHRFEFLSEPYNSYGNRACVPFSEIDNNATSPYSLSRCVTIKATMAAEKQCGCDWENCTFDAFLTCFQLTFEAFYDNAMKTDRAGCDVPCLMVSYPTKLSVFKISANDHLNETFSFNSSDMSSNKAYLVLSVCFDDLLVREDKHVPEYDNFSILGTLGGNVGLFLGASLLTLGEFLELIVITVIGLVKRFYQLVKSPKPQQNDKDKIKLNYKVKADVEAGYF